MPQRLRVENVDEPNGVSTNGSHEWVEKIDLGVQTTDNGCKLRTAVRFRFDCEPAKTILWFDSRARNHEQLLPEMSAAIGITVSGLPTLPMAGCS